MTTQRDSSGRVLCECCQAVPADMAIGVSHSSGDATTVVLCDACFLAVRPELDLGLAHYAGKGFDEASEDGIVPVASAPAAFARELAGLGR